MIAILRQLLAAFFCVVMAVPASAELQVTVSSPCVADGTRLSGQTNVFYTYDTLNRLSTVSENNTGTATYAYDNVGNLHSVTAPNGTVHAYTYDTRNRLTNLGVNRMVSDAPGAIASYAYTLDAAGHRLSVSELSGRTVNYGYDNLYWLTGETIASDPNGINGALNYTYDPVGNRKQVTSTLAPVPAGLWNYDANDRFTAGDTYDNDGNTVSSGGIANVYDFENHLIQKAGVTIVYDGDGNRVSKTVAGLTTKYLVDDHNPTGYAQVVYETYSGSSSGNRELNHSYVYGLELISQTRSYVANFQSATQYIYYAYDGHGSVRALTDQTGAVTDTYDYDAFGILIHSTGTTPNNYLFAGEQFDPDLNLYYNRARYLNTSTGRFWSMDSDEGRDLEPLSLHKYIYANADPVSRRDPSGHDSIAELDISSAISETLDTISGVQKIVRVKDEISSLFDFLSSIVDLGILMGSGGLDGLGVSNLAQKVGSAASDRLGRDIVEAPLNLFGSITSNAPRIATANLLSPAKDLKLAQAFKASDSAVLLYLPGFIGSLPGGPLSTGLKVAGRPLKLTTQGGGALLGMGFQGGGSGPVQLFHVDIVIPIIAPDTLVPVAVT